MLVSNSPKFFKPTLTKTCVPLSPVDSLISFLLALNNVVDAAGAVKAVAEDADISRQHLHRLLSGNGNPTLETTVSILNALGLTIDIKPLGSQP